ncbi:MAG TPA: four helix bundle protein [Vicinamibacterales bacterium]
MSEETDRLKKRTMQFALHVCALITDLPRDEPGPTVKRQLARSSTGIAFNYRSSCRARSHMEFTARIGIVAEEADETFGWLEFIVAAKLSSSPQLPVLLQESNELTAIFSAQVATARAKERRRRDQSNQSSNQSSNHQITQSPDVP